MDEKLNILQAESIQKTEKELSLNTQELN